MNHIRTRALVVNQCCISKKYLWILVKTLIKFHPKVDVTWSWENVRLGDRYFHIAAGLQIRGGMCVIAAENRRYLVLVINDEHTRGILAHVINNPPSLDRADVSRGEISEEEYFFVTGNVNTIAQPRLVENVDPRFSCRVSLYNPPWSWI